MSTEPAAFEPQALRTLTIDHLNAAGDGVSKSEEHLTTIPFALPGDVLRVDQAGRIDEIITASPERAEAFCEHFGRCGGCAFQHMRLSSYAAFKRGMVQKALDRDGIKVAVERTIIAHGTGRRRAIVHVRFGQGGAKSGFMAARTHDLISMETCPILIPELEQVFAVAKAVTAPLAGRNKPLDVQISSTINGLDVDVRGHGEPDEHERARLIKIAEKLDLARISIHRDIIVERRPPILMVAELPVILPPRAFLQATGEAENILADLVMADIGKAKSVADLFCGIGPFALRLATQVKVHAVDDGKESVAALERASRTRQGLKAVTTEARDLFRRPLLPKELSQFDAIVIDPPRAGAEAQMRQIVVAKVKTIISISCDLQSFIRDAKILIAGGYRLEKLTPVDQFAWTRHIELVGIFRR
jgi:23S rRNA (uracil1939-C5)-methyltransferase